jgi:hypothetical protein
MIQSGEPHKDKMTNRFFGSRESDENNQNQENPN